MSRQIVTARRSEIAAIKDSIRNTQKRFLDLDDSEKQQFKDAVTRGSRQGVGSLSETDVDLLRRVGGDRAEGLVRKFDDDQIRKFGLSRDFFGSEIGKAAKARKDIDAEEGKQTSLANRITGGKPEQVAGDKPVAGSPANVELVDSRKLEVVLDL